jgi:hypothetical protein
VTGPSAGHPNVPRHFFPRFGLPSAPRREPVYLFFYQSRDMNGRFAPIADLRLESIVANGIISGINLILSGSRRTMKRTWTIIGVADVSQSFNGPNVAQRSLLTDTGFVLKPYLDRLARCVRRQRLDYKRSEVFLKVACASRSRLGLCGRGCTRDSPIRRSSLPTVRSCTSTSKRSAI